MGARAAFVGPADMFFFQTCFGVFLSMALKPYKIGTFTRLSAAQRATELSRGLEEGRVCCPAAPTQGGRREDGYVIPPTRGGRGQDLLALPTCFFFSDLFWWFFEHGT